MCYVNAGTECARSPCMLSACGINLHGMYKPHKWTFNVPYHATGDSIENGTLVKCTCMWTRGICWRCCEWFLERFLFEVHKSFVCILFMYIWDFLQCIDCACLKLSCWSWILIQMSLFLYRHHGILSRDETARLLGNVDGRYLVRSSSSQPGTDILSFMWGHIHTLRDSFPVHSCNVLWTVCVLWPPAAVFLDRSAILWLTLSMESFTLVGVVHEHVWLTDWCSLRNTY